MQCPTRNHVAGIRLIFKCLDLKDTNVTANWKNEVRTVAESLPYIFFFNKKAGLLDSQQKDDQFNSPLFPNSFYTL